MQLQVNLPIYYTIQRKTKPSSTVLVGDNYIRNAHHHLKNTIKQHYHQLVHQQLQPVTTPSTTFSLHMTLYYKSTNSDPSNVYHQMEKYFLDSIQQAGLIVNDTVLNHMGTTTHPAILDKLNPRCEITLELPDAPI